MVSQVSATHSAPGEEFHDQVGIHGDHSTMVKFQSPDSADYIAVQGRILQVVRDAPSVIERRFGAVHGKSRISKLPRNHYLH